MTPIFRSRAGAAIAKTPRRDELATLRTDVEAVVDQQILEARDGYLRGLTGAAESGW